MADFTLRYDSATGQLVGEDSNGNEIPIPLNALDVSGSASIGGNVEPFTAGHDEVDVPQVRNLTVEDWESGTLDTDVWSGDTSNYSVQSTVVSEGSYALEATTGSSGGAVQVGTTAGLDAYPQAGDTFSLDVRLTGTEQVVYLYFLSQGDDYTNTSARFVVRSDLNRIGIGGNSTNVDISSHLNEWLTVTVEIGLDGSLKMTLADSSDTVLGTLSGQTDLRSGGLVYRFNTTNSAAETGYFDNLTVKRREPEARANTAKGVTELGNEVVPSGAIQTGPQTASTNATRAVYQDAPVDSNATQGTESLLTMLQSGVTPAMYMERTMDGQGGAYGHQLQTALGRFARLNANLSFEYDTFSDVPNYIVDGSDHSASVSGYPRKLRLSNAGSGSLDFGGIAATSVVSPQSLGSFRVTFHGVNSTRPDTGSGTILIGLGDSSVTTSMDSTAHTDNFHVKDDTGNTQRSRAYSNGSLDDAEGGFLLTSFDSGPFDLSFDVRPSEGTITVLEDGATLGNGTLNVPLSNYGALRPMVQFKDGDVAHDTDVQQITVEPLSEVLQ